jgi:NAD(P)-dependent dehydrogenase (short-subunit alcohol dehydrogenase family)
VEVLTGKVAVVTGGAGGIGRGLAEALAEQEMRLVLVDIDEARLEEAVDSLRSSGAEAIGVPADLTDPDALLRVRDAAFERFETVHVLCNNSGPAISSPLCEHPIDVDAWRSAMELLVYSVLHGLNAFLPRMLEQGEGHIVNTASRSGFVPQTLLGVYSPAKAAVISLSETLHAELAERDAPIGVTVLAPGLVKTPSVLAGLAGETEEQDDQWMREYHLRMPREFADAVDPIEVGRLTVRAIQTRAFYVNTTRQPLEWLQRRVDMIAADADRVGTRN